MVKIYVWLDKAYPNAQWWLWVLSKWQHTILLHFCNKTQNFNRVKIGKKFSWFENIWSIFNIVFDKNLLILWIAPIDKNACNPQLRPSRERAAGWATSPDFRPISTRRWASQRTNLSGRASPQTLETRFDKV